MSEKDVSVFCTSQDVKADGSNGHQNVSASADRLRARVMKHYRKIIIIEISGLQNNVDSY